MTSPFCARALLPISVLTLTACEAPPIASQAVSFPAVWVMQTSASGTSISYVEDEILQARLACRRSPDDFYVELPGVEPIGSEDRVSVGAGGQVGALVADLTYEGPGVVASGVIPDGFFASLALGESIGLSYGATQIELPAPDTETAAAFQAACGG